MKTFRTKLNQLERSRRTHRKQASYFKGFFEANNRTYAADEFDSTQYNIIAYVPRGEAPEHLLNRPNVIFLDEQDRGL